MGAESTYRNAPEHRLDAGRSREIRENEPYQVLFVRRKPRMAQATYGPIRHDPGTIALYRDYVELEGHGVRYEGLRAARVLVPCLILLPGLIGPALAYLLVAFARVPYPNIVVTTLIFLCAPLAAFLGYFLVEYALTETRRVVVPLIQIRRVILDPLKGTVMIGTSAGTPARPRLWSGGTPVTWYSFATAYAWAIFDGLEPLLPPGTCGLITRRDRALARGDLGIFLAVCSLAPAVGGIVAFVGIGVGLSAATLGQRRYGLIGAGLCLLAIIGQVLLVRWWLMQ